MTTFRVCKRGNENYQKVCDVIDSKYKIYKIVITSPLTNLDQVTNYKHIIYLDYAITSTRTHNKKLDTTFMLSAYAILDEATYGPRATSGPQRLIFSL